MYFFSCYVRLLEEGDLKGAELEKQRLEAMQRERRKLREEQGLEYQPRFFRYVLPIN